MCNPPRAFQHSTDIYIPRAQIIDTVDIYHLPARQRKLSLRFLAYAVLKSDVQGGGTHDSIEDARTALQLYEAYRRSEVVGQWDDTLEEIYVKGQKLVRLPSAALRNRVQSERRTDVEGTIADGDRGRCVETAHRARRVSRRYASPACVSSCA